MCEKIRQQRHNAVQSCAFHNCFLHNSFLLLLLIGYDPTWMQCKINWTVPPYFWRNCCYDYTFNLFWRKTEEKNNHHHRWIERKQLSLKRYFFVVVARSVFLVSILSGQFWNEHKIYESKYPLHEKPKQNFEFKKQKRASQMLNQFWKLMNDIVLFAKANFTKKILVDFILLVEIFVGFFFYWKCLYIKFLD